MQAFMSHSEFAPNTKGFTLIELLTVIAIIGILAAILIPILGNVRESAREGVCRSNLRQLATAAALYDAENGYFPRSYNRGILHDSWWNTLGPYLSGQDEIEQFTSQDHGARHIGEVLVCPSRAEIGTAEIKASVAVNEQVMTRDDLPRVRMEQIRDPSLVILFADATQRSDGSSNTTLTFIPGGGHNPGRPHPRQFDRPAAIPEFEDGERDDGTTISFRHSGNSRANAAFVDGHVKSFLRGEILNSNIFVE